MANHWMDSLIYSVKQQARFGTCLNQKMPFFGHPSMKKHLQRHKKFFVAPLFWLHLVALQSANNAANRCISVERSRFCIAANSSLQTVFRACIYLILQSFPQTHTKLELKLVQFYWFQALQSFPKYFHTLYFACCRLNLQRSSARCTAFIYSYNKRYVIILHFLVCLFMYRLSAAAPN